MSLTNPNKVITEERLSEFYQEILPYLGGNAEAGFTPVGTIIAVMGNSAPARYLACNGQVVNIADYPILANYFLAQFGSKNYFGGDGTTTFGIPDLRGEFLRGTGTNSHENQGSGTNVGDHQDGTLFTDTYFYFSDSFVTINAKGSGGTHYPLNADSTISGSNGASIKVSNSRNGNDYQMHTSRPTNTSVLYCIATENIFMSSELQYSEDEKVVGIDTDGKYIYQKTFDCGTISGQNKTISHSISNIYRIKNVLSNYRNSNNNGWCGTGNYYGSGGSGTNNWISFGADKTSIYIYAGSSANWITDCEITLQYTKTS